MLHLFHQLYKETGKHLPLSFVLSGDRATITLVSGQISIFSEYRVFGIMGFRNIAMEPLCRLLPPDCIYRGSSLAFELVRGVPKYWQEEGDANSTW